MNNIYKSLILSLLITQWGCNSSKNMVDHSTVKNFEIDRYLGKWYEIARYDHRFERDLVGVTAEYSISEEGKIKVINSGYKNTLDGKKSTAIGKAKIPDPTRPAHLKVSFFWFFYADYFVMDLDDDYQWAIVGSSSDKYLWILSRQPQISRELKEDLIKRIEKRGYQTNSLIWVKQ